MFFRRTVGGRDSKYLFSHLMNILFWLVCSISKSGGSGKEKGIGWLGLCICGVQDDPM